MVKHFVRISQLSSEKLMSLILRAKEMKECRYTSDLLKNKSIVLLFEKSSTRTRLSFETAVFHLGGHPIFLSPAGSQLSRGEPIYDTAQVLSRYNDGVVFRTSAQSRFDLFCENSSVPVINALTDESHPCQIMSDLLTIYERSPDFSKCKIAWIGDGNNVAYSWIEAAMLLDFTLHIACPKGFEPDQKLIQTALDRGAKILVGNKAEEAVRDADYVNTDVWISMGSDDNLEQIKKHFSPFCVTENLMALAASNAKFMHCLPAYRGVEVEEAVIDGEQSIIYDQAENRLHMQKALLEYVYS